MRVEGRRFVARVTTATMRPALLALLIWAAGSAAAAALPGGAEPNPAPPSVAEPNPPGGNIDTADPSAIPRIAWTMAHDVAVWKTLDLGGYTNANMLLEALNSDTCDLQPKAAARPALIRTSAQHPAPHCHLGDSAGQLIARPVFHLTRGKQALDLAVVSVAELGFAAGENVTLEDVYDRAYLLGFALLPAEAGPLLRLQYLDQPAGEFLHVAMQPIALYGGAAIDLTVGNEGGALVLIGGDGRPNLVVPATTRFVFERPRPRPQVVDRLRAP